ncbi:DUF4493 domain-containing protein [Bacteroides ndongoniae]|uniref:DUF4493 domain-containing protein n=1 Tax=Bacteroides ndongoniae TaxID=1903262 RepID=UPI0008DAB3FF|nr:DUF4493 domain-containing protein [Bacteroides ndongoniae]
MKYIKALYAGFIGLLLAACQTEQWEGMEGGFLISLGEDVTVTTKSTPAELGKPVKEQFSLKIVKESTGSTLYDGTFTSDQIPASAGLYTVTATCGENPLLGLDTPYYKGEEAGVEVTEGETRTVNLSCKVANALTSVTYDEPEKFDALFSSYGLKVSVGNQSVTISKDNAKKSAYYRAGTIPTFQFVGTLKDNGQAVSMTLEDDKLKNADTFGAGKHCKLTLKVKPAASGVILTVAKVEVENVTISETIPVEWLPKPKIEAEGFEGNSLSFAETESKAATVKLNTATALQDLKIKFNFADPQFTAFNQEYQLSTLSEDTRKDLEEKLGITLPAIGDSSPSIQLDNLIARLQTNAGEATANTIELDAQANGRWSHEDAEANRSYTLNCNKPEFSVSVDASNCWSREFTINDITVTTGNAETIKNNLIYQYYNGTDWIECSTRDNQKGRVQQFDEAAEDISQKSYRVRALYRGAIASTEAEATLETPEQLPNSGMEEWHCSGPFSHNVYSYYPYSENDKCYWNTNNDYTTRYRQGTFGYPYNCFPAVSYVPGRNGGKAAELRNTASGAGNTTETIFTDAKIDNRNRVAGILFIGDFECSTGMSATNYSYTKTNGKEFYTRPTALKFWYKYLPYTNDTWKAHIELWDENKNIIIQQDFQSSTSQNNYVEAEIKLNYNEQQSYPVCKYIYIIFQSTITEGENMPFEWFKSSYDLWKDDEQISYKEPHIGSILTIDDISLIYDK